MATWIDTASDWAANVVASRDSAVPFTSEQRLLLQELLKQSFTHFGEKIGEQVGEE